MQKARISIIAAIGKNRELGKKNKLLWRIPDDLKRVKALTIGHPIIMGRKTYESIGRPLPNRTNIVISRSFVSIDGVLVCDSLANAVEAARVVDQDEIFVFGGEQIFREALPTADRLYLTLIEKTDSDADAFFPEYPAFKKIISREEHLQSDIPYTYVVLER